MKLESLLLNSYVPVKKKVESLNDVTTRPMFGYQCFSIGKKFFVEFSNKNSLQIIVRLPKDQQEIAIKSKAIKPFSHDVLKWAGLKLILKNYDCECYEMDHESL